VSAVGLILLLVLGGIGAWWAGRAGGRWPPLVAAGVLGLGLLRLLRLWSEAPVAPGPIGAGPWLEQLQLSWIPRFGISLQFGLDGLSLLLSALALFLGLISVAVSAREIRERVGLYYLCVLWTLAGVVGVFSALDLFLFFLFWELMLLPMVLIIGLWGHGESRRAAMKFFLFTQGSGLLLLIGILLLVLGHRAATGEFSFDYFVLRDASIAPRLGFWAMLALFLAFAVKLPVVPFHTWLPDAHTLAPTGGSVLLAGILLKTGGYGMIRFLVPLFPDAAAAFAPAAMAFGVLGILYGAVLAFVQTDVKRLVAYSSISHMGFVLLGVFAGNTLALNGAVLQMLAHGITSAALFIIAGGLLLRLGTLDSRDMGGLWSQIPRLSAFALLFAVATLGLPGFGNFVGEILVLLGTFERYPLAAVLSLAGLVLSAVYALALVHRVFLGPPAAGSAGHDYAPGETAIMLVLAGFALYLGLYPQPVLDLAAVPVAGLVPPVDGP
jgi:NADH-quinone oxidoreductase subunit M